MTLLICFIGLDGSGKSTLTRYLKSKLAETYNIKANIVWVKLGINIFHFGKKTSLIHVNTNSDNPFKIKSDNFFLRKIFLVEILLEHWWRALFSVKIPLLFGKSIICDRYYYDSIVDLVVNFDLSYIEATRIFSKWFKFPEPDLIFYIRIPAEIAYSRKKDNYLIDYLIKRNNVYSRINEDNDLTIISGENSLEANEIEISKIIELYFLRLDI